MKKWLCLLIALLIFSGGIFLGVKKIVYAESITKDLKFNMTFGKSSSNDVKKIELKENTSVYLKVFASIEKGDFAFVIENEEGKEIYNKKGNSMELQKKIDLPKGNYTITFRLKDCENGKVKFDIIPL